MSDLLPGKLKQIATEAHDRKDFAAETIILSAFNRVTRLTKKDGVECVWKEVRDGTYETSCKEEIFVVDEELTGWMKYCLNCGGRLVINTKGSQQ